MNDELYIHPTSSQVKYFTCGVPEPDVDRAPFGHDVGGVVVKHCGDVFVWERICRVSDQQARLADSAVTCTDVIEDFGTKGTSTYRLKRI